MKANLTSVLATAALAALIASNIQAGDPPGKPAVREVADEERQNIEQAIPARAPAKPAKARKLLIFDRNVNYGGHPSIPHANLAFTQFVLGDLPGSTAPSAQVSGAGR